MFWALLHLHILAVLSTFLALAKLLYEGAVGLLMRGVACSDVRKQDTLHHRSGVCNDVCGSLSAVVKIALGRWVVLMFMVVASSS